VGLVGAGLAIIPLGLTLRWQMGQRRLATAP
jgi:hypothetical protein